MFGCNKSGLLPRNRPGDNTGWAVTSPTRYSAPEPGTGKQRRMVTASSPSQQASSKVTRQVQGQIRKSNITGTALQTGKTAAQLRRGLKAQAKWKEDVVGAPG